MQKIYLDHSATTPLDREVLNKIVPYMTEDFGNPNSVHTFGRKAMQAVDFARDTVAQVLNAKPSEIYFTSGGTEGDNWAINSAVKAFNGKKNKILSLPIEHPAVLSTLSALSENGVIVEFIPVDSSGNIHLNYLEKAIDDSVGLVIAMTANNELGTLSPIKQIAKIAHSVGALFLTDAVQAVGVMKIDVKETDADMVVISSHKFYGPKGVGALYCKNGVKLNGYIIGGHQEREKRGGTTNVAGVLGMALALKKASDGYLENAEKIKNLRDRFESELIKNLPNIKINKSENRLPTVSSVTFNGVNGEVLLYNLDLNGVCASNGSACSAGTIKPSATLKAIGLTDEEVKGTVRFSFGKNNTEKEIETAVQIITDCAKKLWE